MAGWIKLHRSLKDWEWFTDPNTAHLFVFLLLQAQHKDTTYRGKPVLRGQLLTGRKHLSQSTGLSEQQVRTALKRLKKTGEIEIKSTKVDSIITVCNYSQYQGENEGANQQANQELTKDQPRANQELTTCKNVKNEENENNILSSPVVTTNNVPYQKIIDIYHDVLPELPSVKVLSAKRKTAIKSRWVSDKKRQDLEYWRKLFSYIRESDFLMGSSGKWKADLDFIFTESKFIGIIEGKYHNGN